MTPYHKIIEEFLIKISQDKEYFVYGNRTEQEVNDIIEIKFGDKTSKFRIINIPMVQGKNMPQMVEEIQ